MTSIKYILTYCFLFCWLGVAAQPIGKYYVYNEEEGKFLSRQGDYAGIDDYGIPVKVSKSNTSDSCSICFLDNGCYVTSTEEQFTMYGCELTPDWAYFSQVRDGVYTIDFGTGEYMGVFIDALNTMIPFGIEWKLVSQKEHDAIVENTRKKKLVSIATNLGLNFSADQDPDVALNDYLNTLNLVDCTSAIKNYSFAAGINGWTFSKNYAQREENKFLEYDDRYPVTVCETPNFTLSQTITDLPNGIYKATIQGIYRSAGMDMLSRMYDVNKKEGVSICNAWFEANGEYSAPLTEWAMVRSSSTQPYDRSYFFASLMSDSKYTTTVWAYVKDGTLTLSLVVPGLNSNRGTSFDINWVTFCNVSLTRYTIPYDDAMAEINAYVKIASQALDHNDFDAVIAAAKKKINRNSKKSDVELVRKNVRDAFYALLKSGNSETGTFDLTELIVNPSFNDKIKGWDTAYGNFSVLDGVCSAYGVSKGDALKQSLENLPAGTYTLMAQGFYRPDSLRYSLNKYEQSKDVVKANIFMNDKHTSIKNIFSDGCYMLEPTTNKSADAYSRADGCGFPHHESTGMEGTSSSTKVNSNVVASRAFEHGHYWNSIEYDLFDDEILQVGIEIEDNALSGNWLAIDNFKLLYRPVGKQKPRIDFVEGQHTEVPVDMPAVVRIVKGFKQGVLVPFCSRTDISGKNFQAIYEIGSIDENTKTVVVYPVDNVRANTPCYVDCKTSQLALANVVVSASGVEEMPVLWNGGVVYCDYDNLSWKTRTLSGVEYDASYFTNIVKQDLKNMNFVVNVENTRVNQYLKSIVYNEKNLSCVENYRKPSPVRQDVPHCVGIPVPANNAKNAVVYYSTNKDMSNAKSSNINDGTNICYIANTVPGTMYYFQTMANGTILTKGKFYVSGKIRMIYAPSVSNIRDFGGREVQNGMVVKYGQIYRGGELNGVHKVDPVDITTLMNLGVKAEIDLRLNADHDGSEEVGTCGFPKFTKDDFLFIGVNDYKPEHLYNSDAKRHFRAEFDFILKHLRQGKPVYFHCKWGADRAGMLSFLLEGLLGFSEDQLCKSYEMTSFSFAGHRDKSGAYELIKVIKECSGATLRDKFESYWNKNVGISKDAITEFRSYMLTPSTAGDINGDGSTNIGDVLNLVNIVIGKSQDTNGRADVNEDGSVNIADVTNLVNKILNK